MESVNKLIAEIKKKDEIRREKYEELIQKQRKKYKALENEMNELQDNLATCTENTVKYLDNLVANKHTIENAMKQTENIKGLPIPYEQHEVTVQLISKMSAFLNNKDIINEPRTINLENICESVIKISENLANDWKDCYTEMNEAEALHYGTTTLKSLITSSEENELSEKLDSCIYNTDQEESNIR